MSSQQQLKQTAPRHNSQSPATIALRQRPGSPDSSNLSRNEPFDFPASPGYVRG